MNGEVFCCDSGPSSQLWGTICYVVQLSNNTPVAWQLIINAIESIEIEIAHNPHVFKPGLSSRALLA